MKECSLNHTEVEIVIQGTFLKFEGVGRSGYLGRAEHHVTTRSQGYCLSSEAMRVLTLGNRLHVGIQSKSSKGKRPEILRV